MLPRLNSYIEPLHRSQNGFRSRRGCLDAAASLNEFIIQNKKETNLVFLDIKAAYDSVDRNILWSRLLEKGMPKNYLKLLSSMFDYNKSFVSIDGTISKEISLEHGLLQGSILSPSLYSAFIDQAGHIIGSQLGNKKEKVKILMYADDMVVASTDHNIVQEALNYLKDFANKSRFSFNVLKCESISSKPFSLYNQNIPSSNEFKYLGILFDKYGVNWEKHFEDRHIRQWLP